MQQMPWLHLQNSFFRIIFVGDKPIIFFIMKTRILQFIFAFLLATPSLCFAQAPEFPNNPDSLVMPPSNFGVIYVPSIPYKPRTPGGENDYVSAIFYTEPQTLELDFWQDLGNSTLTISKNNTVFISDSLLISESDELSYSLAGFSSGSYEILIVAENGQHFIGNLNIGNSE